MRIAKIPIKKAVHRANETAKNNKLHNEAYHKAVPLSSLKIGEILLLLVTGHGKPDGWELFDQLLHRFYDGSLL
jgi:hypothetical protein